MIPWKADKFSLPGLKRHTGELFPFIWATIGLVETELALGQNSTEIMSSDQSNSGAMFLQFWTDIAMKWHERATFPLKYRSK